MNEFNEEVNELHGCGRYNTNKAGMDGLDKSTIMQIILDNSKGSKFYENELRKERLFQKQIQKKLEHVKTLTPGMLTSGEIQADEILHSFENQRSFTHCIVHVDMDAFYAAVELRDRPELRQQPIAVGSKSMLSTSNYIARRFGVRAGLPGFLGKILCPQLKIIPPDFVRYTAVSRVVRSVFMNYAQGDKLATMSLDEAYLDLTEHLIERTDWPVEKRTFWPRSSPTSPMLVCRCRKVSNKCQSSDAAIVQCNTDLNVSGCESSTVPVKPTEEDGLLLSHEDNQNADLELAVCANCGLLLKSGKRVFGISDWEAVREIRFRVFCATTLTCSAGIGPNTLIAKIASDWCKPCGQYQIENTKEAVNEFMRNLPVRKVPGIGHVTERRLESFGIKTCYDLISKRGVLWHVSSHSAIKYYLRIALGHSDHDLSGKSKSNEFASHGDQQCELDRKSMSVERTFPDTSGSDELMRRCRQLANMLSADLKEDHVKGRLLTLKLKLDTFENCSRSQLLPDYTNEAEIIHSFGWELLRDEIASYRSDEKTLTLRLMGLRLSNLLPSEMCPQIRQRSVEEAFKLQATKTNFTMDDSCRAIKSLVDSTFPRKYESLPMRPIFLTEKKVDEDIDLEDKSAMVDSEENRTTRYVAQQPSTFTVDTVASGSKSCCFRCPVCEHDFSFDSEDKFNDHLDECLNRAAVLNAVRETYVASSNSLPVSQFKHRSTTLTDGTLSRVKTPRKSLKRKAKPVLQTQSGSAKRGPIDKFILS